MRDAQNRAESWHRLPSNVRNARHRPLRISATPQGLDSLTPCQSIRTPFARPHCRDMTWRESSTLSSRGVGGANARYGTFPSEVTTTCSRPQGESSARSHLRALAQVGMEKDQPFDAIERHAGAHAPEIEWGRVRAATGDDQRGKAGDAGSTGEHELQSKHYVSLSSRPDRRARGCRRSGHHVAPPPDPPLTPVLAPAARGRRAGQGPTRGRALT